MDNGRSPVQGGNSRDGIDGRVGEDEMKMIDGVVSIVHSDGVNVEIEHKELVMCKNCVHYDDGLCRRWIYAHVTREDSFCSDAERKEE